MEDITENTSQLYKPFVVANRLTIAEPTLRKYCLLIEKELKDPTYFSRDSNNQRLFTEDQIAVIQDILRMKNEKRLSVTDSVTFSLHQAVMSDTKDVTCVSDVITDITADVTATNLPIKVLKELMITIEDQSSKIDLLVEENKAYKKRFEALEKENKEQSLILLKKMDHLIESNEQKDKTKKKFSWFSKRY